MVKPWQSGYSTFSCSPISLIDPKGNTDYYNLKGKKIGTDGVDNGARMLVLAKPTAKAIQRSTEKKQWETLYQDVVPKPSIADVDAMKSAWTKTASGTSSPQDHEEGFLSGGGLITHAKPGSIAKLPVRASLSFTDAYKEHEGAGKPVDFEVHTHPFQFYVDDAGEMQGSSVGPSETDFDGLKEAGAAKWGIVVAGEHNARQYEDKSFGDALGRIMATFYTKERTHGEVPLKQLEKAVKKIDGQ